MSEMGAQCCTSGITGVFDVSDNERPLAEDKDCALSVLPQLPLRSNSVVLLEFDQLQAVESPVQKRIGNIPASYIGLGSCQTENLALRERVGRPGTPFGGVGKFDPKLTLEEQEPGQPPVLIDADVVSELKLGQFKICSEGGCSIYYWVMHPIFNYQDHAVGAEILVRAKNGTNNAPFEDLQFIMDPAAMPCVRQVYASWKGEEIVDWPLRALKEHCVLQSLQFISTNVRPLDLSPDSLVFQEVKKRLHALTAVDRELLCRSVCIEVTEDQENPHDIVESIMAWKDLGFQRFAYDDVTDDLVNEALGNESVNMHTTTSLAPIVDEFWLLKVDIEWAGHMIFLSHPACKPNLKSEVLRHAQEEDLVFIAEGPALRNSGLRHSLVCASFAKWARQAIAKGKRICIELSVRQDDLNNAFALRLLKGLGLDLFGADSRHFCFQGGPLGPKGLEPWQIAKFGRLLQNEAS